MKLDDINKIAIIGAGTMGSGIALSFAQAGYEVILYDTNTEQFDYAQKRVANSLNVLVREGVIESSLAESTRNHISIATDFQKSLEGAQFVIETVPENLELKQQVFRELELFCKSEQILASNTSGLSITAIASACTHAERIAGMHWVNPAEFTPLVEVIRGEKSSNETVDLIFDLAQKIGKIPVRIKKESPGIGLNRLQFAVLRESFHMISEGIVSTEDLDRIMKFGLGFRYPWIGPLETADLGGLDVFYEISSYLFKELSNDEMPPKSLKKLIDQNHLGFKTGHGFYKYSDEDRDEIIRKRDLYFIRQWELINEVKKS